MHAVIVSFYRVLTCLDCAAVSHHRVVLMITFLFSFVLFSFIANATIIYYNPICSYLRLMLASNTDRVCSYIQLILQSGNVIVFVPLAIG